MRRYVGIVGIIGVNSLMGIHFYMKYNNENVKNELIYKDIVIIGGGIAGVSLAYSLAKYNDNNEIMLLEKESIGSGSTGLSAGTIWNLGLPSNSYEYDILFPYLTTKLIKELIDKGYDIPYTQSGSLTLAVTEDEKLHMKQVYNNMRRKGLCVDWLEKKEMEALEPALKDTKALACIHAPLSGHVEPKELSLAIADAARDLNVDIVEDTKVLSLDYNMNNNIIINTNKGYSISAKKVIVASGAWFNELIEDKPKVVPVKGQMWITEPDLSPNRLKKVIFFHAMSYYNSKNSIRTDKIPEFCTHNEAGERVVTHAYGRKRHDHRIIFGGDRQPIFDNDFWNTNENDLQYNANFIHNIIPSLKSLKIEGNWAGPMPFSMDGHPYIGRLNNKKNIFLFAGFGPEGIMEAPGASIILAELIQSKVTDINRNNSLFEQCKPSHS